VFFRRFKQIGDISFDTVTVTFALIFKAVVQASGKLGSASQEG
jgi:hypothetical protein